MGNIEVHFATRIQDRATASEMAARVEKVLGIHFVPSTDDRLMGDVMEASILGMRVLITYWPITQEGELRIYQLSAEGQQDPWENASPSISLNEWVLHLLHKDDSPLWYIPTSKDFLADAKLQE